MGNTSRSVHCLVPGGTGTLPGRRRYVFDARRGERHHLPTDAELVAYTTAVSERQARARIERRAISIRRRRRGSSCGPAAGRFVAHGNMWYSSSARTQYDQILGDHEMGAHDSSLVMYGRDVTPNARLAAREFAASITSS
jgi:hypothetical protein